MTWTTEERAAIEADHDNQIRGMRLLLDADLIRAADAAKAARRRVEALRSNEVYDVEVAEGRDGAALLALLTQAEVLLTGAHAIVKGLPE